MVLALLAGAALGTAGGVALGCQVVPKFLVIEPKDYITAVDISADDNPSIPMPKTAGKPVSVFKKRLLKDTSPWLVHPDYDRAKVLQEIRIDRLDLGTRPPRVDCFKSYETAEDELIVEAPAFWGGDIHVRVTAVVKAGSKTIDVPVDVANVQVVGARGLKGSLVDRMDAFVLLEVRKGRPLKTKVIPNNENPAWNEEFDFVVDTPKQQGLSLVLKDDDLLGASTEGVAVVPLDGSEFMAKPRVPVTLTVPLRAPGEPAKAKERAHRTESGASAAACAYVLVVAGSGPSPMADAASSSASGEKKKSFLKKGIAKLRRHKKPTDTPGEAAEQAVADAVGGTLAGAGSPRSEAGSHRRDSMDTGGLAVEDDDAGSVASTPRVKLPSGAPTGATVTVECTYFPFKSSQPEPVTTSKPGTSKDAPEQAAITTVRRMLMSTTSPDLTSKGVLTVALKKCTNLANNPDTYAIITLYDPYRLPIPNIEFRTEVVMNEDCPRFNLQCDFVNAEDKVVGRMRITLEDVAKEGRIKDQWPLLEAQTGEVHMGLEWNPIVVEEVAAAAEGVTAEG
ncbi:hypothetical protein CHLNCDRAFT_136649 [Chlorella variabilis]|uniref:C2 domain-containing protein n=1 Tax=Chlorella variabilis TaxID=554065 RepID=E1ZKR8_CHLVA|nr:hypothetical protein CHLNCDRAFT_136649 [Chlorella variabilis]EFN53537.1 hypothetical protein CHLNCDRAFT_136649 [Chlorella variabilis]|eukprot:XP_005845639.1 hypothetical protein CHLNCDRAFT_136649 [Chlorella variabilis]